MKKVIHTDNAPKAVGPYSQAVAMGDFLFCSGQISIDPKTNEVFTGDIKTQTEMVMKNVEAVLAANNMNFTNVVKTTIFLTNMADFATVNEIYAKSFTAAPPARSTVAVAALPKGVNVEVEVLAHR
ncbi:MULTISPECIES: RidA family protein [unclassified Bdellovibrio]|jgi:2-iminobutanoate/2-iminopropanoate deaminase|uniref:RidA family protein n=1 Tax=unclassified Bdellovibrio TaxID=2633795 RepID=UPI001157C415|nr:MULTISPECIES: RidA family protein [unclassified Bdellovibrio]QDK45403.1 reactive intermediate/imine deaminase [Bdellovibrio sp. ZAP7]QLY27107.1 RidA family protein [Bdellovibrio sp. KM01]